MFQESGMRVRASGEIRLIGESLFLIDPGSIPFEAIDLKRGIREQLITR